MVRALRSSSMVGSSIATVDWLLVNDPALCARLDLEGDVERSEPRLRPAFGNGVLFTIAMLCYPTLVSAEPLYGLLSLTRMVLNRPASWLQQ